MVIEVLFCKKTLNSRCNQNRLSLSDNVREILLDSLKKGIEPRPLVRDTSHYDKQSLYLQGVLRESLRVTAEQHNTTMRLLASSLVEQWLATQPPFMEAGLKGAIEEEKVFSRSEQQKFYNQIKTPFLAGKKVLAEGSTGIGKTRVLLRLAADACKSSKESVAVIAVPTIEGVIHALAEWSSASIAGTPPVPVFGYRQFVDEYALRSVANQLCGENGFSEKEINPLMNWIDTGMEPRGREAQIISRLNGSPVPGLMLSLEDVAPQGFPCHAVELSSKSDYKSDGRYMLVEAAEDARLLVTTHAMLAIDARIKSRGSSSPLPDYAWLLLDEAHLFEGAVASQLDYDLALSRVKAAFARCDKTVAAALKLEDVLSDENLFPSDRLVSSTPPAQLATAAKTLLDEMGRTKVKDSSTSEQWRRCLSQLANRNVATCWIVRRSRVRGWCSISVGPKSVGHILKSIWDNVRGVACVSGTLAIPRVGWSDYAFAANTLALPSLSLVALPPVVARWIYDPTCHIPSAQEQSSLSYSHNNEFLAEDRPDGLLWLNEVSGCIYRISGSAAGGVLVLCNSYADAESLHRRFSESDRKRTSLLHKRDEAPLSALKYAFLDACESARKGDGRYPILFATGGAWTGLDISLGDLPPADDLALTDLVVTRCPWNSNHSVTHKQRVKTLGFCAQSSDTAFRLRQGIGRLMRREGSTHRRLHILDGRMAGKNASSALIFPLLDPYKKKNGPLEGFFNLP